MFCVFPAGQNRATSQEALRIINFSKEKTITGRLHVLLRNSPVTHGQTNKWPNEGHRNKKVGIYNYMFSVSGVNPRLSHTQTEKSGHLKITRKLAGFQKKSNFRLTTSLYFFILGKNF